MQKKDISVGACIFAIGILMLIIKTQNSESLGIQIALGMTGLAMGTYFVIHGFVASHLPEN